MHIPTPVQITCCENGFVAVWMQVEEEYPPTSKVYASFSPDGTSWTPFDLGGSLPGYAYYLSPVQITCCENGFVATWIHFEEVDPPTVTAYASFSPNGTSWTPSDLSGSLPGYSYPTSQQITCCENRFVATWIQIEDKEPFYTVYASFSPNGTSWTRSDLSGSLPGYAWYDTPVQITCCENRFVVTWIQVEKGGGYSRVYASSYLARRFRTLVGRLRSILD